MEIEEPRFPLKFLSQQTVCRKSAVALGFVRRMAEPRLDPGVKGPVTIREQSIMSKTIAGLAGAACLLFVASTANAATLSGSGTQATGSATSSVILAHGIHTTCQRDK